MCEALAQVMVDWVSSRCRNGASMASDLPEHEYDIYLCWVPPLSRYEEAFSPYGKLRTRDLRRLPDVAETLTEAWAYILYKLDRVTLPARWQTVCYPI